MYKGDFCIHTNPIITSILIMLLARGAIAGFANPPAVGHKPPGVTSQVTDEGYGKLTEGFRLRLEMEDKEIVVGGSTDISVRLLNEGPDARSVKGGDDAHLTYLRIVEPGGQTRRIHKEKPLFIPSESAPAIQPGWVRSGSFRTWEVYQFRKAGTFRITAERPVLSVDGKREVSVISNTVTLRVVKTEAELAMSSRHVQIDGGPAIEGFRLKLELEDEEIAVGGSSHVTVTLQNVSYITRRIARGDTGYVTWLKITDPQGKTRYARNESPFRFDVMGGWPLEPGEIVKGSYTTKVVYTFDKAGTYRITAERPMMSQDGKRVVKVLSNTVTLKVVKEKNSPARLPDPWDKTDPLPRLRPCAPPEPTWPTLPYLGTEERDNRANTPSGRNRQS